MGREARRVLRDRLSVEARFDHGLKLADRMVEAYLASLEEPLDVEPGAVVDRATRRRRFEALRAREA